MIDTGFLTLKKEDYDRGIQNYQHNALLPGQPKVEVAPMFEMSDPVVIEWRALTTAYLDLVADRVRATLRLSKKSLSLSQLLEGGTTSVKVKCFSIMYFLFKYVLCRLEGNWLKFHALILRNLPLLSW